MEINGILRQGKELLKNDELEEAIVKFNEVLESDSNNEEALLNLGIANYENDEFELAIEIYDKLIAINDKNMFAYFHKGNAYAMLEDYENSVNSFTKAIEIDDKYYQAYINRGLDYLKLKKLQQAGDDFSYVINQGYKDKIAYFNMANVFSIMRQRPLAAAMYTKAIEEDENYIMAYIKRGDTLVDLKKYDDALKDYKLVLDKAPSNLFAKLGFARISFHTGQYTQALKVLDEIENNDQIRLEAVLLRGVVYQTMNKDEEAFRCYSRVLKAEPTHVVCNLNLARLFGKVKNIGRALYHYDVILKAQPLAFEVSKERGILLYTLKNYVKATSDFEDYLKIRKEDNPVKERLGKCYAMIGKFDEATVLYEELMNKYPEEAHWVYCYGWAKMVAGDNDKAFEMYNKAIEMKEDLVAAYGDRALLNAKLGNNKEAEEDFLKTIELDPNRPENHFNLANLYMKTERVEEGKKVYKEFAEANPKIARAWYFYGSALRNNKEYEASVEMLDKALALEPKVVDTNVGKAAALIMLERIDEAEEVYKNLIKIYPNSIDVQFMYGRFFIDTKQFEKAISILDAAIETNDKNPIGYNLRAFAYKALGNEEKSNADYEKFNELNKK